ncbi:MAG: NAD(P)H-hydrate dehydratase [Lacibacter sp.]
MKIFSAQQIRDWDAYSIEQEPVASIDLMERASSRCVEWLIHNHYTTRPVHIFCGKGNNGGDGLAVARMLIEHGCTVTVYILEFGHLGTEDFQTNLSRLHEAKGNIIFIQSAEFFPELKEGDVAIDAILGTGLRKPLETVTKQLAEHLNNSPADIISIDVPTGMFSDMSCKGCTVVRAKHTLSFQQYKECFLVPENESALGEVHILNIGLLPSYYAQTETLLHVTDAAIIKHIYHQRNAYSHKGNFGYALLVAGSYGKMGAAVLSTEACLRTGAGLATAHIPACGYEIMQTSIPEAMVDADDEQKFLAAVPADLNRYTAVGIGPGLGLHEATGDMLVKLLQQAKQPVVLDADAINLLSTLNDIQQLLHANCILTPHPKEFERLFGKTNNDFERKEQALQKAKELGCIIVLKGHHSFIACNDGEGYYNSTGNAGMATAGSGDVLTGILTGLLAQGYTAKEAALLGVYIHGLAGDVAAIHLSQEAMLAGDITRHLGNAFKQIAQ